MTETDQARTFPHGVTCWIDVETPDVDATAAFYGSLLGWRAEDVAPPDAPSRYLIATLDGADAAAIAGADVARWATYVAVDDADATVARVAAAGGEVVAEPADVGPAGRRATVRDPEGNELYLWQAGRRLGAQAANVPGAWNFSNLRTHDLDAAQRFYGDVLGWRFVDQGWAIAVQVPGYGRHLAATIDPDILERQKDAPEGFEDVIGSIVHAGDDDPGWHVMITVEDRDATAAEAERLGGTVVTTRESEWTREAVVRDPQGAVFTASQFTPPTDWG